MANPRESLFSGYSNNYSVLSDGDRGNGEFQYQTSNRISSPKDAGIKNARVSYETFTKADGEPNGWRVSGELGPARARYGQDANGSGTFEAGVGVSGATPNKIGFVSIPVKAGLTLFGGVYVDPDGIGISFTGTGYVGADFPSGSDFRKQVNLSYRAELLGLNPIDDADVARWGGREIHDLATNHPDGPEAAYRWAIDSGATPAEIARAAMNITSVYHDDGLLRAVANSNNTLQQGGSRGPDQEEAAVRAAFDELGFDGQTREEQIETYNDLSPAEQRAFVATVARALGVSVDDYLNDVIQRATNYGPPIYDYNTPGVASFMAGTSAGSVYSAIGEGLNNSYFNAVNGVRGIFGLDPVNGNPPIFNGAQP
ncbi:MAG: hypothetical protein ACSHXB_19355 [Sulfitobacter sp.]